MGFVWRVLKRHGVIARDLEDACQEVFVIVHRRHPEFEARSSLRTWLYGIALRVALGFRRKAHLRHERLSGALPETPHDAPQERALEHKQQLSWLGDVLARLDPDKREAFVLYELEGMSLSELASATSVAEGTALYRLHQAREEVLRQTRRAETVAAAQSPRHAGRR